jgi:hypothetical protein
VAGQRSKLNGDTLLTKIPTGTSEGFGTTCNDVGHIREERPTLRIFKKSSPPMSAHLADAIAAPHQCDTKVMARANPKAHKS